MPTLQVCYCGGLVETKPCPSCKESRNRLRNAQPHRRAHRTALHHTISRIVYKRDNRTCVYCGSHNDLTIDYRVALIEGGAMTVTNAVTACRPCNSSRGGSLSRGGRGARAVA